MTGKICGVLSNPFKLALKQLAPKENKEGGTQKRKYAPHKLYRILNKS